MRKRLILLLAGLAALTATAQPTLDDCRRAAREHYPLVRRYELIEASQDFTLERLSRAFLPQVSLSLQGTLQSGVPELPGHLKSLLESQGQAVEGLHHGQYRAQLDVTQTVWDGGRNRAQRREAAAETDVGRRQTDVEIYRLYARVDELFFGLLLIERQTAINRLLTDLLASNRRQMEAHRRGERTGHLARMQTGNASQQFVGQAAGHDGDDLGLPAVRQTVSVFPRPTGQPAALPCDTGNRIQTGAQTLHAGMRHRLGYTYAHMSHPLALLFRPATVGRARRQSRPGLQDLLTGLELPTKSGRRIQTFGLRLTHFPLQLDIMCEKIILVTRILTVSILIFGSRNRQMTDPHQQRIGLRQHASSTQYREQQQ